MPWRHPRSAQPRERNRSLLRLSRELDTSRTSGLGYEHGFIHAPGLIGGFQVKPNALFRFGSVVLNPPPYRGVIHPHVSLLEKLLDLAIGKRVSEVRSDGTEND